MGIVIFVVLLVLFVLIVHLYGLVEGVQSMPVIKMSPTTFFYFSKTENVVLLASLDTGKYIRTFVKYNDWTQTHEVLQHDYAVQILKDAMRHIEDKDAARVYRNWVNSLK